MGTHSGYTENRLPERTVQPAFRHESRASSSQQRIVIVSNRLPIVLNRTKSSGWEAKPAAGGLVAALRPVLQERGGLWVGWSGAAGVGDAELAGACARLAAKDSLPMRAVALSNREIDGFYQGFSNEIIWPLFHDMPGLCNFDPDHWRAYRRVNRKFAEVLAAEAGPDDFIWVHDYHLMLLGGEMSRLQLSSRRGFFLHIPFPSLDLFRKLPWRQQIINGLLGFDLIAFQTDQDRRNFLQCAEALGERFSVETEGAQQPTRAQFLVRTPNGKARRHTRIAALPISIDYSQMAADAAAKRVHKRVTALRNDLQGRQMILGVDRLDYTKGILHRLRAFRLALERHTELRGKITLVQHLVPSRETIGDYALLRRNVEQLVSEINGRFTEPGWVPIHYMYHSLSREELLANYRLADIALITPLKDGMNLVAKEYCAAQIEENGVLILSEFAGAAAELQGAALLINPHDLAGTAEAIYQAFMMPSEERMERMRQLRLTVRNNDVYRWADAFLTAAASESSRLPAGAQRETRHSIPAALS